VLKFANGHPLILGEGALADIAGLEVAQADVQLVPGLGGAGGMGILDQMRDVIQQKQHPTFKFSRQYSWHRALVRPGAGVVAARRVPQINGLLVPPATPSVNCGGGAGNGAWPCRAGCASPEASDLWLFVIPKRSGAAW